ARRHLGEAADRRLGGAVVRLPRVAEQPRARAEGDDPPVAPLAHVRAGVADAVEGALQMHGDDRVPLLLAHVEDHPVAQDAGAGDERIETAPRLERRADDARGALPGGDRVGVGDGPAAGAADLLDHIESGAARGHAAVEGDAVVVHDHLRALGGEPEGDAPADAAARASDDRDAAGEHVCHECDLPRIPRRRMLHRARGSGRGGRSSGSLPPPMLLSEHDRPTALHYRILALTWAGWLFDFYDLILYTFLLAPISRELGLGREAHAVLLGASLGATALGGALFGYLADRFGRKAVLEWSILTYSAGTVLCGLAPEVATLLAARVVTGLGVGLAFGLAVLNMSSYWFTYTWLPTYLTEERGLSIASSGLKILVVVCGELLGYASFGLVSDRVGRKPAFSLYAMLMAAGLVSITLLWRAIEGWPPLLLFCLWIVGFGTGTWSNFGPMFAELFPTRLRTTAVGTVFNAARGVQLVTPLV